jgi:SNF2 family DNA or RNA helicase
MKVLHGSWIPQNTDEFVQTGSFYLWVETLEQQRARPKQPKLHDRSLRDNELEAFLKDSLGVQDPPFPKFAVKNSISTKFFALPTTDKEPLPSIELSRYLEADLPDKFELQYWEIYCYRVTEIVNRSYQVSSVIKLLNDLHFLSLHEPEDLQLGNDLLFWYHYTQRFKTIILKDQYIPALKYRELKTRSKKETKFEIYPTWEIISEQFEADLQRYVDYMPLVCTAGVETPPKKVQLYDKATLLRHFSECLLNEIVTHTPHTQQFDKQVADTFIYDCVYSARKTTPYRTDSKALEEYKQWQIWRDKISRTHTDAAFDLLFQLQEAPSAKEDWLLEFWVASKKDPSYKLPLEEYWDKNQRGKTEVKKYLGKDFEKNLLLNLGYAARIYPKLWDGLETDQPVALTLKLEDAFAFLKETAWVLEDAGYRVAVPAWWTPSGRRRAKLRLKAGVSQKKPAKENKGYFSLDQLIQYQYQLAIGDEAVSEAEWRKLINAKTPLVQFRGQWIELDREKMQEMLEFWQKHAQEHPEMSLIDLMKLAAGTDEDIAVEHDNLLSDMLSRLQDKGKLELLDNIPGLQGTLREYQQRGVSWLNYLDTLGLNGCLADDMGLGKTVQVIARLLHEKSTQPTQPTLLIAPTSVVGNWQKEIEKFAPQLRSLLHHGTRRFKNEQEFQTVSQDYEIVITSYTLARKDAKLLSSLDWHRIVLDEAQNIKNPHSAQTKAICKLPAQHRLALTGTPVENRLMDLWSIFNFLNPGYLGKEAQFRKQFELPIQKENDRTRSTTLKKLVEPLILRRVKTDKNIIKDLPDKVEQKLFCNLTKEQASLYEAVVKDMVEKVENAEGIDRRGLILSALMKLKQICNHPAQFLQDNSDFLPERSHKLSRLSEMVSEVMEESESLLIFTQFKEIGDALEHYLKHTLHLNTYYIHGGTNRNKREQMITEFQDPETEPSVFILSLKAGGVGITLTKANHVFHFDRWWNPAVEDQATDRAFRIGQKKNVFVHKFVAIGTLEERIDQMIEDKKKLAGAIVGNDESWLTELDNEAFKKLIALNKNVILE